MDGRMGKNFQVSFSIMLLLHALVLSKSYQHSDGIKFLFFTMKTTVPNHYVSVQNILAQNVYAENVSNMVRTLRSA